MRSFIFLGLGLLGLAQGFGQPSTVHGPTGSFTVQTPQAAAPVPVLSSVDVVPKTDLKPFAEFPSTMEEIAGEGVVWVDFTVTEKGKVEGATVKASSNAGFEEAALKAVNRWKFTPGQKSGAPVSVPMRVAINFSRFGERNHLEMSGAGELKTIEEYNLLAASRGYDMTPVFRGEINPIFPYELLMAKVKGTAEVEFVVTPQGKARNVRVLKATHPEFGEALAAAIEAGDFFPASKKGQPVAAMISIEHPFDQSALPGPKAKERAKIVSLLESDPDKIISPKKLDVPLKPNAQRAPVFPGIAKSEDGSAVIEVVIDKEGHVLLPKIVSASQLSLGYAAAQAVDAWRFEKPISGGKAAVVRARIPFKFAALKAAETQPAEVLPPVSTAASR